MGKGLHIQEDGLNIAFVAGTGSLVFVDLVALLLRINLDLMPSHHSHILTNEKFKFVLFASFQNRYEAVGIEIMEGLDKICKAKGINNYEFHVRFSDQKGPRWDS